MVIYDLGGGTFDVAVVAGDRVLAANGLADAGGLDIDEALTAFLGAQFAGRDAGAWERLRRPGTLEEHRDRHRFVEDVRTAKEMLSRTTQTFVHLPGIDLPGIDLPGIDTDAPVGREQLDAIAEPLLRRTVRVTRATIVGAGLPVPPPGLVHLVGGATRMPLVASMLHRELGVAPTATTGPAPVLLVGAIALASLLLVGVGIAVVVLPGLARHYLAGPGHSPTPSASAPVSPSSDPGTPEPTATSGSPSPTPSPVALSSLPDPCSIPEQSVITEYDMSNPAPDTNTGDVAFSAVRVWRRRDRGWRAALATGPCWRSLATLTTVTVTYRLVSRALFRRGVAAREVGPRTR